MLTTPPPKNPAKVCVFCGNQPVDKNREHVIPRWLMRMTGDPKRAATFGGFSVSKKFALDQFTAPSCSGCNSAFAVKERQSEGIVASLLNRQPITALEAGSLLDWFDKVRIGFWLASLLLQKNPLKIRPMFHVNTRQRGADRLLYVGTNTHFRDRLHFPMNDDPVFHYVPSFFFMIVNHLYFVNVSTHGIASRGLGFPYLKDARWLSNGASAYDIIPAGRGHRGWNAIPQGFAMVAQAVWPHELVRENVENVQAHIQTDNCSAVYSVEESGHQPCGNFQLPMPFRDEHEMIRRGDRLYYRLRQDVAFKTPPAQDEKLKYIRELIRHCGKIPAVFR